MIQTRKLSQSETAQRPNTEIVSCKECGEQFGMQASGTKSGYTFAYTTGATDATGSILQYAVAATPTSVGLTGQRRFFTDQSGVIRGNATGAASINSTPLS